MKERGLFNLTLTDHRTSVRFRTMRNGSIRAAGRSLLAVLALVAVLGPASPASAAYPRRVAVAPFASLTPEDIGSTVAVLPRLVSSRLMALAGADVLLLPAGGKSPEEAAREAKYPLLLQGTVAKLGKGYSIDVTVTDLSNGARAGAFFTAAATIDDIIPQLGVLSGEIAEKVFGVQGAMQAVAPPPPVMVPAPVAVGPQAIGGGAAAAAGGAAGAAATAAGVAAMATPAPTTLATGWAPSSIKQVSQSDKIPDELYGMVMLGPDGDGNDLVAAYGKTAIYIYRVKGDEFLPYTRYPLTLQDHILEIAAIDLDGDGVKEILVTDLVGGGSSGIGGAGVGNIDSFVLKRAGATYDKVAGGIHYYLIVLPDWHGKPEVVGQYRGIETPFEGKIVPLHWDGKGFVPGPPFSQNTDILPLSSGILGLSSARFGKEWRLVYTDQNLYLRVVDAAGVAQSKSANPYGGTLDFFEWGPYLQIEGRRARYPLRHGVRVAPGSGDDPVLLIPEVKKTILLDLTTGVYDSTRVALLRWDGGGFATLATSPDQNRFFSGADFLSAAPFAKGGKIVASVIEKQGSVVADKVSRLVLFRAE